MKTIKILVLLLLAHTLAYSQVKVLGKIIPNGLLDAYPTHLDSLGYAGFRVVADATERNAIPTPRRKVGMFVYQQSDSTLYRLQTPVTANNWTVAAGSVTQAQIIAALGYTPVSGITTGTTGTDINSSVTGSTINLNIPDASLTARGVITTGTQTITGTKTFSSPVILNSSLNQAAYNLYIPSSQQGINQTVSQIMVGGVNTTERVIMRGSVAATPGSGAAYAAFVLGDQGASRITGGSHPLFTQQAIKDFTVGGTGTLVEKSLLYIEAPTASATNNYSVHTLGDVKADTKVIAGSFNKVGGDGTNLLLDNGSTTPLSSLAIDANVVHKTGTESIAGPKTFTATFGTLGINTLNTIYPDLAVKSNDGTMILHFGYSTGYQLGRIYRNNHGVKDTIALTNYRNGGFDYSTPNYGSQAIVLAPRTTGTFSTTDTLYIPNGNGTLAVNEKLKTVNGQTIYGTGNIVTGGFNNPMTTTGDLIQQGASGPQRLAGNASTDIAFLSSIGNGTTANPVSYYYPFSTSNTFSARQFFPDITVSNSTNTRFVFLPVGGVDAIDDPSMKIYASPAGGGSGIRIKASSAASVTAGQNKYIDLMFPVTANRTINFQDKTYTGVADLSDLQRPAYLTSNTGNTTIVLGADYLQNQSTQIQFTLGVSTAFGNPISTILVTGTGGAKILVPLNYVADSPAGTAATDGTGCFLLAPKQKVQIIPTGANSYYIQPLNGTITKN